MNHCCAWSDMVLSWLNVLVNQSFINIPFKLGVNTVLLNNIKSLHDVFCCDVCSVRNII